MPFVSFSCNFVSKLPCQDFWHMFQSVFKDSVGRCRPQIDVCFVIAKTVFAGKGMVRTKDVCHECLQISPDVLAHEGNVQMNSANTSNETAKTNTQSNDMTGDDTCLTTAKHETEWTSEENRSTAHSNPNGAEQKQTSI